MKSYDHKKIEKKWQKYWDAHELYKADDDSPKPKLYTLIEFPYPSGAGLHVGHPRPYTAMDVVSRKKRMEGYNVLYPIGWDAFGLPTENYAIKTGQPPQKVTKENIATFKRQIKSLGISFDWSREVNTTDPKYYKWTQWIFLQLFKHGLAYKAKIPINWCVNCKISLANEEVVGGVCERCGGNVEKRLKDQWMLAITKYADKLLDGLKNVDYIPQARTQQENWIGRSEGAEVSFKVADSDIIIKVFTTRPDTLFGATYMVLAPEHELIEQLKAKIENWKEVDAYVRESKRKSDLERTELQKEKTGVELRGVRAVNPANGAEIPVWVADYVLGGYGTGAIMAVPAHDERDFEFAKKYGLPIKEVVIEQIGERINGSDIRKTVRVICERDGKYLVNYEKKMREYMLVGGGVDEGESLEEAVKREIREETGYVNITIERYLGTAEHNFLHRTFNKDKRFIEHIFVVRIIDGEQIPLDEHELRKSDPQWLSAEEMLAQFKKSPSFERHREFLMWYVQGRSLCFSGEGVAINSDFLDGLITAQAKEKMISWLEEKGVGARKVQYKLRDWVFSRQRYWGEPIPLVYCEACAKKHEGMSEGERLNPGWIPLPESELPLTLPAVKKYEPTDTGESPLATMEKWVKTHCPKCGDSARRETDTMPNWAGSSWYFLRYTDPHNDTEFASMDALKKWMPVDWYNGGMEHTVLHLLYSRFWNEFLYDIGAVPVSEPYTKRTSHGMILAKGGEKMSKSKGNVVNPDDIVAQYGADTMRTYIMFMGPFDQAVEWDPQSLVGVYRFLERVWSMQDRVAEQAEYSKDVERLVHQTIKRVGDGVEDMNLNTPVAQLMTLSNALYKLEKVPRVAYEVLLVMLSLYAPHICEELWEALGHIHSITLEKWPSYNTALLQAERFELVIQINGKVRDKYMVVSDVTEAHLRAEVLKRPKVQMFTQGAEPKQFRYIHGKIVSIVV